MDKQLDGLTIVQIVAVQKNQIAELQAEVEKLQREVSILRQYGNKDCTAMADAVIEDTTNEM